MAGMGHVRHNAGASRLRELHDMCISTLQNNTTEIDAWGVYGELKQLRPADDALAMWLEAMAAALVVGRIRPARAIGLMRRLRERRKKQGQTEAYTRFEALVQAHLGPLTLTTHGYGRPTFGSLDHESVWEQVSQRIARLSEAGYRVFLNSGTLLGVIRDGKLIDHDDDIDLAVILQSSSYEDAAEEWQWLKGDLTSMGLLDEAAQKAPEILKLKPIGQTQIDLFPAWIEKDRFFIYPHTYGELSTEDVLPLRICETTGHPLPARAERMLDVNYGRNWRIPDPLFRFPWTEANSRFAPFMKAISE